MALELGYDEKDGGEPSIKGLTDSWFGLKRDAEDGQWEEVRSVAYLVLPGAAVFLRKTPDEVRDQLVYLSHFPWN